MILYNMRIIETVKSLIRGWRDNFPPKERDLIDKYGDYRITNILIFRVPIHSMIDSALNIMSIGKWQESKDNYNFDKLFHLFAVISMNKNGDNVLLKIEKNEVIRMSTDYTIPPDSKMKDVGYFPKKITFNELIQNMVNKFSKEAIFKYDPWTNNCQKFILMLLEGSNLLSPYLKEFIYQDITNIVEDLPEYTKYFGSKITELAHRKNILFEGYGFKQKHKYNVVLNKGKKIE